VVFTAGKEGQSLQGTGSEPFSLRNLTTDEKKEEEKGKEEGKKKEA